MYFSCKITNAILNHLESEKIDLSGIFSEIESELDIPWENVRDTSNWMRAPDMEALLERIISDHQWLVDAGHSTPKKKVWGVLDLKHTLWRHIVVLILAPLTSKVKKSQ